MLDQLSFSVIEHHADEDGLHFRVQVAPLGVQIQVGSTALGSHRTRTSHRFGQETEDVLKRAVDTVEAFLASRPDVRSQYPIASSSTFAFH